MHVRAALMIALVGGCAGRSPAPIDDGVIEDAIEEADAGHDPGDAGQESDAGFPDGGVVVDDDTPVFVNAWGRRGIEPGEFIEPSSVELDSLGFVYAAGHEDRIQKFTRDGELVAIFGESGLDEGQFNHPHGLAVDRARGDLVYIGDQENRRVQVFNADGEFSLLWNDPDFIHIHDVGIDIASGDIYVGDYEADMVQKFSASGEFIAVIGGPGSGEGEFSGVWGISTDSTGNVYIADTFNRRVQKLDRDGVFIAQWLGPPNGTFEKPTGVFVDNNDVVYICDSLADAVYRFSVDGEFIGAWNLPEIVGGPSEPEDIVIDGTGTHLYIADVRSHRIIHLMHP